ANKVSDRSGNYLAYSYAENNPTGEFRISEIRYTGNAGAGLTPYNYVKFDYADRGGVDISPFYRGGSVVQTTKLLTEIRTCLSSACTGSSLVRQYIITYDVGRATQRYRVAAMQ